MTTTGINEVLDRVKDFAERAHGEQKRKYSSDPYIVHPVRVMKMCREYTNDIAILAAALLHDVLEDTDVASEEMEEFLLGIMDKDKAVRTVKLVNELTDIYVKSAYPKWNRRKRKANEAERQSRISSDAQTIKYADIIDNAKGMASQKSDFSPVFLYECRDLLKKIDKGDKRLYKIAVDTVNNEIDLLYRSNRNLNSF